MSAQSECPAYGVLVIAQWPDARRPAWFDQIAGWVRLDTDERGPAGAYMPRISWGQTAPLSWEPIEQTAPHRVNIESIDPDMLYSGKQVEALIGAISSEIQGGRNG